MSPNEHFNATIVVDNTPEEVFAAVADVRGWWSEDVIGDTAELGDEFVFMDAGIRFCRFRLTEVEPARRVVWHVVDAYLGFIEEHDEWTGTDAIFEITPTGTGTSLRFIHRGLMTSSACYAACSKGWSFYIHESLPMLLETGMGRPIPKPVD